MHPEQVTASVSSTVKWRSWAWRFSCTLQRHYFLWLWDRAGGFWAGSFLILFLDGSIFSSSDARHRTQPQGRSELGELGESLNPTSPSCRAGSGSPERVREPVQGHTASRRLKQEEKPGLEPPGAPPITSCLGAKTGCERWGRGGLLWGRKQTPLRSVVQAPAAKMAGKLPESADLRRGLPVCNGAPPSCPTTTRTLMASLRDCCTALLVSPPCKKVWGVVASLHPPHP